MPRSPCRPPCAPWLFAASLAAAAPLAAQVPVPANGKQIYDQVCSACHPNGSGGTLIRLGAGEPDTIRFATQSVGQMLFLRDVIFAQDFVDLAAYLLTRFGPQPGLRVPAVEYYNAALDHYFISALQPDIDALDSGRLKGWARTGQTFNVWPATPAPPTGASPVCRFYLPPANGDSHFYSASPAECDAVKTKFPTFSFESPQVMYVILPDATTGACPPATRPVYRVWNQRADSNHRYTIDLDLRAQMIGRGYVGEGYGPDAVAMCSPN